MNEEKGIKLSNCKFGGDRIFAWVKAGERCCLASDAFAAGVDCGLGHASLGHSASN